MINVEKQKSALWAINAVLVMARAMAYDRAPHADLADVLDTAEYLPMLMLETADRTSAFRETLACLAQRYPRFGIALQRFDEEHG